MLVVVTLSVVAFGSGSPLSMHVNKHALMEGDAVTVACRISELPPHSQDTIEVGVSDFVSSTYGIKQTPYTVVVPFHKVPCGADEVYCHLTAGENHYYTRQQISVTGCN